MHLGYSGKVKEGSSEHFFNDCMESTVNLAKVLLKMSLCEWVGKGECQWEWEEESQET